jgi:hypothetical protein
MTKHWTYIAAIYLISIGLLSCEPGTTENHSTSTTPAVDSLATSNQTSFFDPAIPFEIQSAKRGIDKSASEKDTTICTEWKLTEADVPKILKSGQPISGEDHHHFYYVLPCMMSGTIEQGGKTYNFEMNAGAWFTVSNKDSSSYYGNFNAEIEAYFMMGKDDQID